MAHEPGAAQAHRRADQPGGGDGAGRRRAVGAPTTTPARPALRPVVLDALADLRGRYDVVICEGAGSAAEINLLAGDLANLPPGRRRPGCPRSWWATSTGAACSPPSTAPWRCCPTTCGRWCGASSINRFRGDPALLGDACAELERRCGRPDARGRARRCPAPTIDAEDSLALDRWDDRAARRRRRPTCSTSWPSRFPRVANFGDLDPLRLEPAVRGALGAVRAPSWAAPTWSCCRGRRPPGPTSTGSGRRAWPPRSSGRGRRSSAVCAGAQMVGPVDRRPRRAPRAHPVRPTGSGWLPLAHARSSPARSSTGPPGG